MCSLHRPAPDVCQFDAHGSTNEESLIGGRHATPCAACAGLQSQAQTARKQRRRASSLLCNSVVQHAQASDSQEAAASSKQRRVLCCLFPAAWNLRDLLMRMVAAPAFDIARTCGVVGKAAEVHDQHWRQLEQLDGLGGIRLYALPHLQSGMEWIRVWVSNGNPSSLTALIASVSTLPFNCAAGFRV